MPHISALNGPANGRRYELTDKTSILGRHPECDVILEAGAVSRQHAKIDSINGEFVLEDLESRNGTFLNGRLISESTTLQDGDLIRICDLEFSYHGDIAINGLSGSFVGDGSSIGVMIYDDEEGDDSRAITTRREIKNSNYGSQILASADSVLVAVLDIMKSLGGTVSLEEVLQNSLDCLFKIFVQADRGFIVLRELEGEIVPKCVKTRRPNQEETVRISRTVVNQIMEQQEALISLDASNDERFEMSQSVADFRIRSMLAAPLINSDGESIGVLQIDTVEQKNRFEEKDLEILLAVANQAGIAIENAQLHESVIQQKAVEQDLELAKQVQIAFLPSVPYEHESVRCFQFYNAANAIGGDYFDYIRLSDDKVAVVVADVVGHGVAAAMFMAKLSAETRFVFAREDDPTTAMAILNQRLYALGIEKMVTALVVILNPQTGSASAINAGHMPPLLRRNDGSIFEPSNKEAGLPLGIMDDQSYESADFVLEPGECFVMYTDGIFEAPDSDGKQFSINRLRELVKEGQGAVQDTGRNIIASVEQHVGNTPQEDDMCLVVVGRN